MYTINFNGENEYCVIELLEVIGVNQEVSANVDGRKISIIKTDDYLWSIDGAENIDTLELAGVIINKDINIPGFEVVTACINIGYNGDKDNTLWPIANPWKVVQSIATPISKKEFAINIMSAYRQVDNAEIIVLKLYNTINIESLFMAISALEDAGAKNILIEYGEDYYDRYTLG